MTILYSIPFCSITFYSVLLHYSIISFDIISYDIVLYHIIILYDILLFYTLYHIVLFHIPTYSSSRVLSKYTSQGMHVFLQFFVLPFVGYTTERTPSILCDEYK